MRLKGGSTVSVGSPVDWIEVSMSRYGLLWEHLRADGRGGLPLSFLPERR